MVVHYCTECRKPVTTWTWPKLPEFTGSTKEHTSEPPTLEPCGHVAFTYTTGETPTYPSEG